MTINSPVRNNNLLNPTQPLPERSPSVARLPQTPSLDDIRSGEYTIGKGDKSRGVADVQELLNQHGAGLAVDGKAGQQTHDAILRFQAANGLTADGVVGPKTLAALGNGGNSVEPKPVTQRRADSADTVGHDAAVRAPAAGQAAPDGALNAGQFTRDVEQQRRTQAANAAAAKKPPVEEPFQLGNNSQALPVREFSGGGNVRGVKDENGRVGAASWDAKMAIDSDGASNVTNSRSDAKASGKRYDPDYQKDTSLKFKGGVSADANKLPFAVLPPDVAKASGAKPGDLMQVSHNGKNSYAIYADVGPKGKIGEGSMALARNLGINDDPRKGGVDSGVKYTVLPGSGKQFGITPGGKAPTAEEIQQKGAQAFEQARAKGLVSGGTTTPRAENPAATTTPAANTTTPAANTTTPAANTTTPAANTTTPAANTTAPTTSPRPEPRPETKGDVHVKTPWYSQFDGAHVPDAGKNACFRAARVMANQAGGSVPAGTGNRIQVATGENASGGITVNPARAKEATNYIDQQLAAGKPVVVGVSHKNANYNADGITDHFVTITGRGTDAKGRPYYTFNDPASGHKSVGGDTNPANRFYPGADGKLSKEGNIASGYVVDRHFEMSMVVRNQ